jgi:hypothetical protein
MAFGTRVRRIVLGTVLWFNDLLQYVVNAIGWLLLTPLITLLLIVLAGLDWIPFISVLESTLLKPVAAILNRVVMYWIAPLRLYLQSSVAATAVRETFEREVDLFQRDRLCERIIVVAHSWGTVIAFDGLSNLLADSEQILEPKPLTFICLAQALRRAWLLGTADPTRLLVTFPDEVRWIHLWARYDPVPVGPLTSRSLPPLMTDRDPDLHPVYEALATELERCENIGVVNTDSFLSDHTTYWSNMEQVVGRIAAELVAGHPELEQLVRKHLATADDVLLRRWRIAWRGVPRLLIGLAIELVTVLAIWHIAVSLTQVIMTALSSKGP